MRADDPEIVLRLVIALIAGTLIGFERSYQGRPAGVRTHALVCTASSLLMLVTAYEAQWMRGAGDLFRLDPTRMAQGIMTGIGFLGAGVIFREGLSIRGLTTAASIWITAALGILAGIGFYFPLAVGAAITLGVLSGFRLIEERMPSLAYFHLDLKLARAIALGEEELRALIARHGFSIANFSYRVDAAGAERRHSMVIRSPNKASARQLAATLEQTECVLEFRISPTGD